MNNNAAKILIVLLFAGAIVFFRDNIGRPIRPAVEKLRTVIGLSKPCTVPITYSINNFDDKFGISREQLVASLSKAESVWEKPINRDLFLYVPDGGRLQINMVYDYRQVATDQLSVLGDKIESDKTSYEAMRSRYESLVASYERSKALLNGQIQAYNSAKASYETEVDYWNQRNGAPKEQYGRLENARKALNEQADSIRASETELNSLVTDINSTANTLNRTARNLNLKVDNYNTIGASTGPEFDEGEYVRDAKGERINIFQFDDTARLDRLLAHEFGHALDMHHVDDPEAIMYAINAEKSIVPTATDIAELRTACKLD